MNKIDITPWLAEIGYDTHQDIYPEVAKLSNKLVNEGGFNKENLETILKEEGYTPIELQKYRKNAVGVNLFGTIGKDFDHSSYSQLMNAAKLPVATEGALMPDAHQGYALPIGGVLALENAISPYFIGFDIACRMSLTILAMDPDDFKKNREALADDLNAVTSFGLGARFEDGKREHELLDRPIWNQINALRIHKDLAARQLGSSGGGNHFANLMVGEMLIDHPEIPVKKGEEFVAIMTHSGSRGAGHKLATWYAKKALQNIRYIARDIPKNYEWLPMDSELGQEYWKVIQTMGDYAKANHELIHKHFMRRAGIGSKFFTENHHNFAWKHEDVYIHRKGATPAHDGQLGLIGGSVATPSYLTIGKGNEDALWSCSHGAGRTKSRRQAKDDFNEDLHNKVIGEKNVLAIGVNKDESFQAYKNIEDVMALQEGILLDTVAKLEPSVVIMGGGRSSDDGD